MTSADDVLAQINHALEDWSVSEDAMRWQPEAPKPQLATLLRNGTRVFVTTSADASIGDWSDWTELGHTVDGATFTYRPPPPPPPAPDFSTLGQAFSRLRVAARRVGVELADWQVRVLAAMDTQTVRGLAEAGRVMDELTGPEMDPDKPGRAARRASGVQAQQSPYGPKRRGQR